LKNFVCYRSNFILDALLNFEPVKRFKNWSDVSKCGSFKDSSSLGISNELKTTELRLRKVKAEGVAVIEFGMHERGFDGASSGKVESVSYPSKIFE